MLGNKYCILILFPIGIFSYAPSVFYLLNIFLNYWWLKKGVKSILYCQFKSRKENLHFPYDKPNLFRTSLFNWQLYCYHNFLYFYSWNIDILITNNFRMSIKAWKFYFEEKLKHFNNEVKENIYSSNRDLFFVSGKRSMISSKILMNHQTFSFISWKCFTSFSKI